MHRKGQRNMYRNRKWKKLTVSILSALLLQSFPVYAEETELPETELTESAPEEQEIPAEQETAEETEPEDTEYPEAEPAVQTETAPETEEEQEIPAVQQLSEEPASEETELPETEPAESASEEKPEEQEISAEQETSEEAVPEEPESEPAAEETVEESVPEEMPAEEKTPETEEIPVTVIYEAYTGLLEDEKGNLSSRLACTYTAGSAVDLPVPQTDEIFVGWAAEENGPVITEEITAEEDMTLHAVYAQMHTEEITLVEGETFEPESTWAGITYVSDNEKIVSAADGVITAVAPGTAAVTGSVNAAAVETYQIKVEEAGINEKNRYAKDAAEMKKEELDGIEGFVTRMYQLCLDREPDAHGLKDWCTQLREGRATGASIARGFFYSKEYTSKKLKNVAWIKVAYRVFLNRESDSSGLNYWVDALEAGCTYDYILRGFIESQEFTGICEEYGISRGGYPVTAYRDRNIDITRFVSRLYVNCLGRKFDGGGLEYWTRFLYTKERTPAEVARGFFYSRELAAMNLSNEEFVRRAYVTILDRNPEEKGQKYWVNKLNNGMSRADVVEGFLNSTEFTGLKATLKTKKSGIYDVTDEKGQTYQVYYDWNGNIARESFLQDQVYYQVDPQTGRIIHMQKQQAENIFMEGIDISTHNGDINLKKYQDGFVIIRVAYGTNTDQRAVRNMNLCEKLKIPYGVYLYSYALSPSTAEAEADYLLNLIKGRDIQCGVWYDMEDADFYKQRHHVTDSKTISAMCQRFCKKVQDAGYHVGIYASYSWFKEGIISGCDEYDKWVAHWGNNDGTLHQDFSGFASIHQYTSNPLDRDVMYVDPKRLIQ